MHRVLKGSSYLIFFFKLEPHLPPTASPAKSLQLRHQILLRVPSRLNQQPCEPHLNGHKRRSLGVWSHGCSGRTEYEIKRRVPCSSSENSSLRSCGWDRPPPKQKGQVAAALICFSLPRWRKLSVPFSASSTQGRSAEWSPWWDEPREHLARSPHSGLRSNKRFFFGGDIWLGRASRRKPLCCELECFSACSETLGIFSDRRRVFRRLGARRKTLSFTSPPTRGLSRVIVVSCPLCKNGDFFISRFLNAKRPWNNKSAVQLLPERVNTVFQY